MNYVTMVLLLLFAGTSAHAGGWHKHKQQEEEQEACNEVEVCVYHPLELDLTCCPSECIQMFTGETVILPEVVFKITADRRGNYDLRREIIVSPDAPFTVSHAKFRHSFLPNNGDDCQLQTILVAGPNDGPLVRNDPSIPHSLIPDWIPEFIVDYQTVAWLSVAMRVTGTAPGTGSITVVTTIDNYHF